MVKLWTSVAGPILGIAAGALAALGVLLFVDLSPRVESDFFFAQDDPQMEASREVARRFPLQDQVILRVEDRGLEPAVGREDPAYRARLAGLTADLEAVEGVEGGFSVVTDDPAGPLFRRILLTPDPAATNLVLQVGETAPETLLPRIEAVVEAYRTPELEIVVSGVPAIVEMIRRSLFRDLVVFSLAAIFCFALLMSAIYRDGAVVLGTLATCVAAVGATLLSVQALDVGIGLLTANLVTIVFVLTLSHIVFLTGNWRRAVDERLGSAAASEDEPGAPGADVVRRALVRRTVRDTAEGSFWSMATTFLGFASLLLASARPLRELGTAGVVGAVVALAAAYLVYPAFLGRWARVEGRATGGAGLGARGSEGRSSPERGGGRRGGPGRWILPAAAVVVVVLGMGVFRLDTDPGLLSYFDQDSELHRGLSRIDRDGGSSTLHLVVADPGGADVDDPEVFRRMESLQSALEADSAVGVVLSPTVLIAQARTVPLAGFLPVPMLLDLASGEALDRIALGFVTPDRGEARFYLRMRETSGEPRDLVLRRIRELGEETGLEPVLVAGLYDLQERLGRLIASSLRLGIGGLLLLFLVVALFVSRSPRVTFFMWLCLASIPAVTLGAFGHLGVALDLITSPAANIALAIGADSMIHLTVRARRLAEAGDAWPWARAVEQIGPPVLSAAVVVCAGFGIFALSSFPPTGRFGFAVIVGTVTAAAMALAILPRLAILPLPTPSETA